MKLLLLTTTIFFCGILHAQVRGSADVFGYEQSVAPGTQRSWSEGNENEAAAAAGKNYLIYMAAATRIYPVQVWIRGEAFSASIKMAETPVTWKHPNIPAAQPVVLVPKTSKQVIELIPRPLVQEKKFDDVARLAAANELLVVYKMNGKFYYNSLTRLTPLPGVARQ